MNLPAYWRRPFSRPDALAIHVADTTRDACDSNHPPRMARIDRICFAAAVVILLFLAYAALKHASP